MLRALAFSIRRSLAFTLLGSVYASQVSAGAVALTMESSAPASVVDPQNGAAQTVGDDGLDGGSCRVGVVVGATIKTARENSDAGLNC